VTCCGFQRVLEAHSGFCGVSWSAIGSAVVAAVCSIFLL